MADKVTFDFDTGEIIFDTPEQNGDRGRSESSGKA